MSNLQTLKNLRWCSHLGPDFFGHYWSWNSLLYFLSCICCRTGFCFDVIVAIRTPWRWQGGWPTRHTVRWGPGADVRWAAKCGRSFVFVISCRNRKQNIWNKTSTQNVLESSTHQPIQGYLNWLREARVNVWSFRVNHHMQPGRTQADTMIVFNTNDHLPNSGQMVKWCAKREEKAKYFFS